ncbi:MAG: leucine-rich repeat domain-containing protein, partial [Christensenellaceae bacterium]
MKKLFVALRAIVCLALAAFFGWFSYLSYEVFADRVAQRKDNALIAKLNAVVDGSVPNSYDELLACFAKNGVRQFTLTQREPWLFYSSSRNVVLPYNEWMDEDKAYSYRYAEIDFDRDRLVARVISSEPYSCDYLLTLDADIAALLSSPGEDLPAFGNACEGEILGYVLTHTVFYNAEGIMFRYERSEDGYAVKRVLNAKSEEFVGYSLVLLDGVQEAPLGFFEGSYFYRLYLPDSVAEITPGAFKNCRHLESVRLPSALTEISRSAFENCVSLTEVSLPRCRKIGISAFAGCTGLTRLTLSAELTTLAVSSFEHVPNLSLVVYDGTRAQYETIAGRIPLKEGGTLSLGTTVTPS